MTFSLPAGKSTKALLAMLAGLARDLMLTGGRVTIPILNSILVDVTPGSVRFRMTNVESQAEITVPCEGGATPASVLINLGDFIGATKGASALSMGPKHNGFVIETDLGQSILTPVDPKFAEGYPTGEFGPLKPRKGTFLSQIDASGLTGKVLDYASHAASHDATKPALSALCLEIDADGHLALASTNGFRLAHVEVQAAAGKPNPKRDRPQILMLPRTTVTQFKRLTAWAGMEGTTLTFLEDPTSRTFDHAPVLIAGPGFSLKIRPLTGNYPAWRRVVPSLDSLDSGFTVDRKAFLKAVESASSLLDPYNRNLLLFFKDGTLEFVFKHPDRGIAKSNVKVTPLPGSKLDAVDLAFDAKYLMEFAKTAMTDSLTFRFKNDIAQCVFQASEPDAPALAELILMPIRYAPPMETPAPAPQVEGQEAQEPEAPTAPVEATGTPEDVSEPQEEASRPQDEPVPASPKESPETRKVWRADLAAIQILGGLQAMHAFPVAVWHRHTAGSRALAWEVAADSLTSLGIVPLTEDQAQKAYQDRKALKAQRHRKSA